MDKTSNRLYESCAENDLKHKIINNKNASYLRKKIWQNHN